ncbi:Mediator Of Rna polymerase Ii Transcription Subunit 14 [Manis pentadactyla]|nr:Mediator Of Rna polymerase Ii Transcription Subunit 14 [Manis pentadactyla]
MPLPSWGQKSWAGGMMILSKASFHSLSNSFQHRLISKLLFVRQGMPPIRFIWDCQHDKLVGCSMKASTGQAPEAMAVKEQRVLVALGRSVGGCLALRMLTPPQSQQA